MDRFVGGYRGRQWKSHLGGEVDGCFFHESDTRAVDKCFDRADGDAVCILSNLLFQLFLFFFW
jgi:hypothetical protein